MIARRRFPRSIPKRRPQGSVGGKTRKMGFIGKTARTAVGRDRFCVALFSFFSLSLSLSRLRRGMDSHGTLHTPRNADTYARARTRVDTYKGTEEPPLPRVPTCFRPQAAVITAQSRVVDQQDDERRRRCSRSTVQRQPACHCCRSGVRRPVPARQSPLATRLPPCASLPEATWNVGHDLEVDKVERY